MIPSARSSRITPFAAGVLFPFSPPPPHARSASSPSHSRAWNTPNPLLFLGNGSVHVKERVAKPPPGFSDSTKRPTLGSAPGPDLCGACERMKGPWEGPSAHLLFGCEEGQPGGQWEQGRADPLLGLPPSLPVDDNQGRERAAEEASWPLISTRRAFAAMCLLPRPAASNTLQGWPLGLAHALLIPCYALSTLCSLGPALHPSRPAYVVSSGVTLPLHPTPIFPLPTC